MGRPRVLAVDDDGAFLEALVKRLDRDGYDVVCADSGERALEVAADEHPHVVLSDLVLPGMDGVHLGAEIKRRTPDTVMMLVTGHVSAPAAIRALQSGADHYLLKPIDFGELQAKMRATLVERALRPAGEELREPLGVGLGSLIGGSPVMRELYAQARRVAQAKSTVLLTGESGTGKGELASSIHRLSCRAGMPFVSVHCAALAPTLIESELFGHERGSFTGANRLRIGRFEQASGGTLFLDEVSEIPLMTQVKLLRVLQERKIERVGGERTLEVDVRLIAATNRSLVDAVRDGRFREDLFYRLNVVALELPPLDERVGDVELLARAFFARHAEAHGRSGLGLSSEALAALAARSWKGNVRELDNVVERAVALCPGPRVQPGDLHDMSSAGQWQGPPDVVTIPGSTMREIERYAILTALGAADGSTSKAADMLHISARTIQHRLREWGMARPPGRRPSTFPSVAPEPPPPPSDPPPPDDDDG